MALRFDMYNRTYDDAEPVFCDAFGGTWVYDRLGHDMVTKASLMAYATKIGYTLAAPEIGEPSNAYKINNDWPGEDPAAAAAKPITASVTKAPATTADDTGEITVAGGPADKAYTVTITVRDAASGGDDVQNVPIPKGSTAASVAALVAAAVSDPNVTAKAVGVTITVKPKAGSHFTKLTVSIA